MQPRLQRFSFRLLAAAALAVFITAGFGMSNFGGFTVDWYTMEGGGGTSAGGAFDLSGTIGQHDAGPVMTGGTYALSGGYWAGGATASSCPTDLTGDGTVDSADLAILLGSWGPCSGCPADLDGNGEVNSADLAMLLGTWGPCPN